MFDVDLLRERIGIVWSKRLVLIPVGIKIDVVELGVLGGDGSDGTRKPFGVVPKSVADRDDIIEVLEGIVWLGATCQTVDRCVGQACKEMGET